MEHLDTTVGSDNQVLCLQEQCIADGGRIQVVELSDNRVCSNSAFPTVVLATIVNNLCNYSEHWFLYL